MIRNYGAGREDIAARLQPLLDDADAQKALEVLRRDFQDHNGVGPRRVAEFLTGGPEDTIQADVVGDVAALLDALEMAA